MSATDQTLLLPSPDGVEAWRAGSSSAVAMKLPQGKVKDPAWIAVPMRSVVSVPMRFPAMPADRQMAAAALELEGAGLHNLAQTDLQIETRDAGQRDQRAWTAVLAGSAPAAAEELGIDSQFAPTVAFRKLRAGQVALWSEQQRLTIAVPDEQGQPLHAQALTAQVADEDAAAELRCILAALELAGMEPAVQEIVAQRAADEPPPIGLSELSHALNMPVQVESSSGPVLPAHAWGIVPGSIVQQREKRKQRQQLMLMAAGTVFVILAMLAAFGARLWTRERAIASESVRLDGEEPSLQIVREAQDKWQFIEKSVNPQRYAVEIFSSIAEKLPAEGIRLTNFQITEGGNVTLDAEASNQALAGQLREDLNGLKCFEGMTVQVPPFGLSGDGRATFHADAFLPTGEEAPAQ